LDQARARRLSGARGPRDPERRIRAPNGAAAGGRALSFRRRVACLAGRWAVGGGRVRRAGVATGSVPVGMRLFTVSDELAFVIASCSSGRNPLETPFSFFRER